MGLGLMPGASAYAFPRGALGNGFQFLIASGWPSPLDFASQLFFPGLFSCREVLPRFGRAIMPSNGAVFSLRPGKVSVIYID